MSKKAYKPQAATLIAVIQHLQELGLSVYGPTIDKYGCQYNSLMDYTSDEVLARRKHIESDTLHEYGDYNES